MKAGLSNFLQSRFNLSLYLLFGWTVSRFIISFLVALYYFLNREEKKNIHAALDEALQGRHASLNSDKLKQDVFRGISSHYYEKLYMAFESPSNTHVFFDNAIDPSGIQKVRNALAGGKGVIIVTGHYGAIEYIPVLMAIHGLPVSMIAKFKTKTLKKQAFSMARQYGVNLIDAAERGSIVRCAIDELRKNRVIVTQCDEISEWRPSPYEALTFLGKRTGADRTITLLQKRTDAAIVFAVLKRASLNSYKLIVHDLAEMREMISDPQGLSHGAVVLKCLESYIYRDPAQWYEWKKYPQISGGAYAELEIRPPALLPVAA